MVKSKKEGTMQKKYSIVCFVTAISLFFIGCALAGNAPSGDNGGIGTLATNVTGSFGQLGKLMAATSYLAGFGFAIAGVFKFKQHKDNPTQIPMGTPIALLAVGIILIFLPGIIKPAGVTIFNTSDLNNTAGGFTGGGATNMPGGNT